MNLTRVFVPFFLVTLVTCNSAFAGPFTDAFGKCLVRSTTENAKLTLVAWIFIISSEHPALENITVISERQKAMADMAVADIVTNLYTKFCEKEALEALQYEGEESMGSAFTLLGKVSMQELMQDKNVSEAMLRYTRYLDRKLWDRFLSRAPALNEG